MSLVKNDKKYNGLVKDMNSFAKFIYIYESQIKALNSFDDFSHHFSEASNIFIHSIRHYIRYASIDDLNNKKEKVLVEKGKQTLFFTKSKVQVIDFCRHLRNSFCHALLNKDANALSVPDCKGKTVTSKGHIEYSLIKKFIAALVHEYESKY